MSEATEQENTTQKENSKEYNFAAIRKALEEANKRADNMTQEKEELAHRMAALESRLTPKETEEDDDEPYLETRKFKKEMSKLKNEFEQEHQKMKKSWENTQQEEKRQMFLKEHPDFNEVLNEESVIKFATDHPELAEPIANLPNNFDRQKLMFQQIKFLNKKEQTQSNIQESVNQRQRGPFYQPTGVGNAPSGGYQGDFSEEGKKKAWEKMKQMQKTLRLG